MNLQQIKDAVDRGVPVYYGDKSLTITKNARNQYQVKGPDEITVPFMYADLSKCFTDCKHDEHEDCMVCTNCGQCREDLDSNDLCMDCGGVDEDEPSAIEMAEKLSLYDEAIPILIELRDLIGVGVVVDAEMEEIPQSLIDRLQSVIAKSEEISK